MSGDTRRPVEPGITRITSGRTGAVTYQVRWSYHDETGRRRQGSATRPTLKAARALRAQRVAEVAEGRYHAPTRLTVDAYAATWLDRMAREWASSTAYTRRHQYAHHVAPRLGARRLGEVTRYHLVTMIDELAATYAPANVRSVMALVSALFRAAERDGLVPRNVAAGLPLPAPRPPVRTVWTPAQVERFLAATTEHPHHPLYTLLLSTGLRIGEALALRWAHVDLAQGMLLVTDTLRRDTAGRYRPEPGTKTTRDRLVPLTAATIAALTAHRERQRARRASAPVWDLRGYVFTGPDGQPLDYTEFARQLRAWWPQLPDLPPLTAHGMRHTVSVHLRDAGIDPSTRGAILGHSPDVNVATYSVQSARSLRAVIAALDATLAPDPGKEQTP